MRKALNFKRLACLLAVLGLGATCVHFLHGFQVQRNARALLQQADRAEAAGQSERASEYLERYLAHVPSDTDTLARYGFLLVKLANAEEHKSGRHFRNALFTLSRVLGRAPGRHDVRRAFVDVAMKLKQFAEAQESLEDLLRDSPNDGKLRQLLAQCYEATEQDYRKAADEYKKAIQAQPHDVNGYVLYASLLRRWTNDPQQADPVMGAMVGANHEDFRAYLARSDYRKKYDAAEKANEDVRQAYKLAPDKSQVLRAMAHIALDQTPPDFEKARGYLEHALKLHPEDGPNYRAMARLEAQAEHRPEAIACLRRGIDAVPRGQRLDLLWDLANVLAAKKEDADEAAKILKGAGFPATHLKFLHARILVTRGEWLSASRELEGLHKDLVPLPELATRADLLLGHCYQQLGNPDQQYAVSRRAEKLDSSSLEASLGVASSLVGLGRLDEAIAAYRVLIPRKPALMLEVARLLVLHNQSLPRAERDWREAEAMLQAAAKAMPDVVEVAVLQAEVRAWQGEMKAARAVLAKARAKRVEDPSLWVASAALEELEGKSDEALAILEEAARKLGDRVEVRLALARYWGRHPGPKARPALAKLGQDRGKFKPEEQDRLLRNLAAAFVQLDDVAEARRLWDELAKRRPSDLGIKAVLFDLALEANDDAETARALEDIRHVEGEDGTLWRYGKACHLIWQARKGKQEGKDVAGTLDEAHRLVDAVAQQRPAWSFVPVCAAQIDMLKGNKVAAIRDYLRAVNELGNRDPETIRQLILLLHDFRRYAEAELVLRKLPEEISLSPPMERVAADISFSVHDYDRAVSLAEKAVSVQSKDYRDYLWLGMILSRSARRQAEAERALRQAVAMAGDKPEARVALVQYLVSKGAKDQAAAEVRAAEGKFPRDQAPLALAPCYDALGDAKKANELYQAALADRPDEIGTLRTVAEADLRHGRWDDAEAHLHKILDLAVASKVIASKEDSAWARRVLALVLTARGDYQHSREALTTLGILEEDNQPVAAASESPEDQRMRAVVLAAQRNRRQRREAIRVLENLLAQEPPTPDDQFLLAQLYESVGDWPQARGQMLGLLSADGSNALYLAFFVQAQVTHQELNEVEPWLDKLRKVPGADGTLAVVDVRARLLAARDRADEAVTVLREYVASKDARPESQSARRVLAASLLENLGQSFPKQPAYAAAAETMYRAYAAEKPENRTALAGFLGRQGRLAEALRVCEQAWQTSPPEAVGLASVIALRDGQPDARQYRLVEGWLASAIAKNPKSAQLIVCRGYLRDVQGYHDEAAALYRQVLEQDGLNLVALNNLATLCALRGQRTEALNLIDRALQKAGPVAELRDTHAMANLASGQVASAIDELEEVVAERPQPACYFHLAQAYLLSGKEQEAREALRKAKDAGLRPSQLHRMEHTTYERLVVQLATK